MTPVRFDVRDNRVSPGSSATVINETDEYALEQALAMREAFGGSVTAVTAGGLVSQEVLYLAKAKGADRAIRVDADCAGPVVTAEALARAISSMPHDIILTGIESFDSMTGQTGIYLAEKLGLPFAYAVISIDVPPGGRTARIKKELGGGVYQVLDIKMPAVFCVPSGIQRLKYTPAARLLKARRELLDSVSQETPGTGDPAYAGTPRLVEVFKPERMNNVEIIGGEPGEIATAVVDRILEAKS